MDIRSFGMLSVDRLVGALSTRCVVLCVAGGRLNSARRSPALLPRPSSQAGSPRCDPVGRLRTLLFCVAGLAATCPRSLDRKVRCPPVHRRCPRADGLVYPDAVVGSIE